MALVLLLLIVSAAVWNAFRLQRMFRQVDRTQEVLAQVEQVLTGVLSMQSGARGFVLIGRDEVLAPFHQGQAAVAASLPRLQHLTAENPVQQQRLAQLTPMIEQVTALLSARVSDRRGSDFATVRDPAMFVRSQRLVEQVRELIAALVRDERQLLTRQMRETWRAARATIVASIAGTLIAIAFAVGSVLLVRRDFRDRQRSEQALNKSQRMFQRLFDNAPDAIIQVNQQSQIVRANRQAEALFGWGRDELGGRRIEELMPDRFQARHGGHLTAYFAAPRTRPMGIGLELYARHRDGSEFPVDIMLSPLDTDDGIQALAVVRNVTERKAIEEKIRRLNLDLQLQNARLEIANSELEAFSYSVSHDLRAPLRHIDGFAALLSQHAAAGLDDKSRRFIATISDSARRMGRLIDDLLTFSRTGRTQLNVREVNQIQLVAEVIRDSEFDRNPRIQWQIAPLPPLQADAAMLRQVWFNLLDNAVKYSARSDPPRIEVGCFPDPEVSGAHVCFVRDNGVGFEMKYAAKLFGVFQRLHTEAEFEGTGIGLANVRRIITRHGGRTWAESAAGAGATFYFSLPTTLPEAPPA